MIRIKSFPRNISILFILIFLMISAALAGCTSKERYRKQLEQKGIAYSVDSFLAMVGAGYKETTDLFLKAGMDVDAKGNYGETALMLAAVNNNPDMVNFLIEKGADINEKTHDGYTVLMLVSTTGNLDLIKLLIKKGAKIDAKNNEGETALMLAVLNDNMETIKLLIEKDADINAQNNYGETALDYAFLNTSIKDFLREAKQKK